MVDPKQPLKLTLRRAALLHAIRFGAPPWMPAVPGFQGPTGGRHEISSAVEVKEGPGVSWLLCCGHEYGVREIHAMEAAGWILTNEKRDWAGRRITTAGPNILEAWQHPAYE